MRKTSIRISAIAILAALGLAAFGCGGGSSGGSGPRDQVLPGGTEETIPLAPTDFSWECLESGGYSQINATVLFSWTDNADNENGYTFIITFAWNEVFEYDLPQDGSTISIDYVILDMTDGCAAYVSAYNDIGESDQLVTGISWQDLIDYCP